MDLPIPVCIARLARSLFHSLLAIRMMQLPLLLLRHLLFITFVVVVVVASRRRHHPSCRGRAGTARRRSASMYVLLGRALGRATSVASVVRSLVLVKWIFCAHNVCINRQDISCTKNLPMNALTMLVNIDSIPTTSKPGAEII